jgi:hypothetical protein
MSDDLGLTPAAATLTAVFSSSVPAAPAPAPTAPTTPIAPPAPVELHSHAGLYESEAATMADWTRQDVASGKLIPEAAAKIFDDLGTPMDQRVTPPDTRSDEQKLIDQHFPPAKPEEFSIRYADPGQSPPPMTPEMKQFDQSARTWLSAAEFPRELGNSLITTIERVAQTTKHLDANQLEQYGFDEFAKLERVYGKELDAKLQQAAVMIDALDKKQPGLKNLLRGHGVGDSALVVAQIIGQSERWHARRRNHG